MKKLVVLENDIEHQGIPDMLQDVLDVNEGWEVEPWFWFSQDVRQNPERSFKRFASMDENTWCISYPSFVGLGNSFDGKLHLFNELMEKGIKIRLYVVYYPDFYWFLVDWLHDVGAAIGDYARKRKKIATLKKVLKFHEIYSAPWEMLVDDEVLLEEAAKRVTWDALKPNYYPETEKLMIKKTGKVVEFSGISVPEKSEDVVKIRVWESIEGKGNYQTTNEYDQDQIVRIREKKVKKPKVVDTRPEIEKGRLTTVKFVNWLNQEFKRLEIKDYTVTGVERTRFRLQDYEAGACKLYVRFAHKKNPKVTGTFLCFFNLGEYQDHMKMGYEMYVTFQRTTRGSTSLSDITVDLRKKEKK